SPAPMTLDRRPRRAGLPCAPSRGGRGPGSSSAVRGRAPRARSLLYQADLITGSERRGRLIPRIEEDGRRPAEQLPAAGSLAGIDPTVGAGCGYAAGGYAVAGLCSVLGVLSRCGRDA